VVRCSIGESLSFLRTADLCDKAVEVEYGLVFCEEEMRAVEVVGEAFETAPRVCNILALLDSDRTLRGAVAVGDGLGLASPNDATPLSFFFVAVL